MSLVALHRLLIDGRGADHTVATRQGKKVSFAQFRHDVTRLAAKYKKTKSAALLCNDSYNFAVGLLGLLHAGADVVLPPHDRLQPQDGSSITVDDQAVEKSGNEEAKLHAIDPEKLSLIFYTSGSTGVPKSIYKNLAMFEREIEAIEKLWSGTPSSATIMATVPHQHVYGMTFRLLWPLMSGRPFTAETHVLWENAIAALEANSLIISSPAHLERLEGLMLSKNTPKPLRIFSAGAPLSYEASNKAADIFGCRVTEIFGSSETGAFATRCQNENDAPWHPLPGVDMRMGPEGRLELHSSFIGKEWTQMDDAVEAHQNGFRFLGRIDRIAKIEGKRVHLGEVEANLMRSPLIDKAAVVMLEDKRHRLAAAIILSDEGQKEHERLGNFRFGRFLRTEFLKSQEPASVPRLWRFVTALPTNNMGKQSDRLMRALFENDVNLPRVLDGDFAEADTAILKLDITADLLAFEGHFPDKPILPGVVQVDWAIRFAVLHLGITKPVARDFQVKFRQTISPGEDIILTLKRDRIKKRLSFTYNSGDTPKASGTIMLEAEI